MIEASERVKAVLKHSVGAEVYDLIDNPPQDPIELGRTVLGACDTTYKDRLDQLPVVRRGHLERAPGLIGYPYPSALGLDDIEDQGYVARFVTNGRRGRSTLRCEVEDSDKQTIAVFEGTKQGEVITPIAADIRVSDAPVAKIIGGALIRAKLGVDVVDLTSYLDEIQKEELGYHRVWADDDGNVV